MHLLAGRQKQGDSVEPRERLRAARIVAERDPAGQTVVGQRHAAQHIILDEPKVHREAAHSLVPLAVAVTSLTGSSE